MSVRSEYGFTKQEQDHALFYNKRRFEITWEGYGEIDNSPDVNGYLLIDRKYRGLYVPELTYAAVRWQLLVFDHTNTSVITSTTGAGIVSRASGGNVAYSATVAIPSGTVGGGNFTVTPTANTTVQALEIVLSDSDSQQTMSTVLRGEFLCIHTLATGNSSIPTFNTAALTTAE
jgi:hypothetical protein